MIATLLVLVSSWVAYRLQHQRTVNEIQVHGTAQIEYHTQQLLGVVERFKNLPALLAAQPSLSALLQAPDNADLIDAANQYLAFSQSRSGVSFAYLIDTQGRTLAASNWQKDSSFIDHNYGFRPYFQDAMKGRTGIFYGVGVTTGKPGAFLAGPILAGGKIIGVVAVKIDLTAFEDTWIQTGTPLVLADRYGIIFLTAQPAWRYRSLDPISPAVLAELQKTRQYGDIAQRPLRMVTGPRPSAQGLLLRADNRDFLVQGRSIEQLGWQLMLFDEPRQAIDQGLLAGALAGLAAAFTLTCAGLGWQFRRRRSERLAARSELAQVVAALEQRIATRTAELTAANDTAVQTGKLALLGQMAAGISHEMSQPLAALRTMADNASVYLNRNDTASARKNLGHVSDLCERLGNIVGELKAFARKEPARLKSVPLSRVVSSVLMLIEPHRCAANARIQVDATELWVTADSTRLEQVLLNLIRNGIDAMEEQADRRLDITIGCTNRFVTIAIRDHGQGLSPEVQAHLFEPFFTTKPSGKGLGLGLALSQAIIKEMGATLSARNTDPGAQFDLTLQRSNPT